MAAEGSAVPIELFYHICENLPKDTLANVAQASSTFQDVSEKLMYRRLHLSSTDQALRCCQAVVKKPSAAQAVQELIIMIDVGRAFVPPLAAALASTFDVTNNLTALHLAIEGPYAHVLANCYFPKLGAFSSVVEIVPMTTTWDIMADFLRRHTSITHLCMGGEVIPPPPPETLNQQGNSHIGGRSFAISPAALPILNTFMGSRRLASLFVPYRPVERVTLAWHTLNVEAEVDRVVPALSMSSKTVKYLNCATLGWSPALICALAVNLPHLRSLRLYNLSTELHNESDLFTAVSEFLPRFPDLVRLELPCGGRIRSILAADAEQGATRRWHKSCPGLAYLQFPSGRVYQRRPNGPWAPLKSTA